MHDVFDVIAPIEIKPLPIPEEELLARYEQVQTASVSDVLDKHFQLYQQVLPSNLHPAHDGQKVAGFAMTIKSVRTPMKETETSFRNRSASYLGAFFPHSIAVVDCSGDEGVAHFGEMMCTAAKSKGCIGAVIDGGIRDLEGINALGVKTWARYRTPRDSGNRARNIAWMIPIRIADVLVNPGDVVYGDIDGIVVVPREIAYEVLQKAENVINEESSWRDLLLTGISPTEAVEKGVRW